ncbi:MAG: GTPase ObgE [Parachlamydiales bacterium]|jgi:GTP-binding protein
MFIDSLKVKFIAGNGGNGAVAFRREKFIPKGGPSGGDGGKGGSIILEVDDHLLSLEKFFHRQIIKAEDGHQGGSAHKKGKDGSDLIVKVPIGTIVKEKNNILFEFTDKNDKFVVCKGGKGGRGNSSFRSSTNQAPNNYTEGQTGETKEIHLELKLIAEVGLIGMPNAGKSTILKQLTNSKAKIGDYPFTTLYPNIGLLEFDDYTRITVADIPGIIKGAHQNKGLGIAFLKHIERTSILIFVVDISSQDPISDFEILIDEINSYSKDLLNKPFLTILNKIDLDQEENIKNFKKFYPFKEDTLVELSALNRLGFDVLVKKLKSFSKIYKKIS